MLTWNQRLGCLGSSDSLGVVRGRLCVSELRGCTHDWPSLARLHAGTLSHLCPISYSGLHLKARRECL